MDDDLVSTPEGDFSVAYMSEDLGPSLIMSTSAMTILCTAFLVLHYTSRYLAAMPCGVEDVLYPFAWLSTMALAAVDIMMVKKAGLGRHVAYNMATDAQNLEEHLIGVFCNELIHPFAVAIPKICVVLVYLRVFTGKGERMAAKILIGAIMTTCLAFTIALMFQCRPFKFNWDKTIPDGTCFDIVIFGQSSSIPNIVTDLVLLILPIRTVTVLKISKGRKIGLMIIFLTGGVGIVASVIRTYIFFMTDLSTDWTYTSVALIRWTLLEPSLYLLAACSLSFKPLFRLVIRFLQYHGILKTSAETTDASWK
ncbi:unnamed protein product [Periconia digitata]|uniref:Rhodopsin domain-containing protein n=1 Tax=Periconia digitata TaxID=1303443 RepID=A0A9W4UQG1_9PLEO|nr:unnamed protein product [Periconia digitata]